MSALTLFNDDNPTALEHLTDHTEIAARLDAIGVRFERWKANQPLATDADQQAVLAAYHDSIDTLNQEYGFTTVDVVALGPDHPQKTEMRNKFLNEHTHDDFEVRFFVDGRGIFYIRKSGKIYATLCEKGDLISVPANTKHWFDMGERNPSFKCIRFFTKPEGWVGNFTGDKIASRFPTYDQLTGQA